MKDNLREEEELRRAFQEMRRQEALCSKGRNRVARAVRSLHEPQRVFPALTLRWGAVAMALVCLCVGVLLSRQGAVKPVAVQEQFQETFAFEWQVPTDNLLTMSGSLLGYTAPTTSDDWLNATTILSTTTLSGKETL